MISDRENADNIYHQLSQLFHQELIYNPGTAIDCAAKIIDEENNLENKLMILTMVAKMNISDKTNHWLINKAAEILSYEANFASNFKTFLYILINRIPNCPFIWCYLQHQVVTWQDQLFISQLCTPDTIRETRAVIDADIVRKELSESEFQTQPVFMDACIAYIKGDFRQTIDLLLFSFSYPAPANVCLLSEQILDISFEQLASHYQEFLDVIRYEDSIYYIFARYNDMEYDEAIKLCDEVLLNPDQVSNSTLNRICYIKASSLESLKQNQEALKFFTDLYVRLNQDRQENYYLIKQVKYSLQQCRRSLSSQSIFAQPLHQDTNAQDFFDNSMESPLKKRKF